MNKKKLIKRYVAISKRTYTEKDGDKIKLHQIRVYPFGSSIPEILKAIKLLNDAVKGYVLEKVKGDYWVHSVDGNPFVKVIIEDVE